MKLTHFFVLLMLFLFTNRLFAQKIYGILAVDIVDVALHEGGIKDLDYMTTHINRMAQAYSEQNAQIIELVRERFNKETLNTTFESLELQPDDIVIFYYSGHGFWNKEQGLILNFDNNNSMIFNAVNDIIKGKNASLKLIITDCCKEERISRGSIGDFIMPPSINKINNSYYKSLLSYKGSIIAQSCSSGQNSISTSNGSYFTIGFLKALSLSVNEGYPSWNVIAHRAISFTEDMVNEYTLDEQTPEIEVIPSRK